MRSTSSVVKQKYFGKAMLDQAIPNQILITQTVKNLLSGAGLSFTSCPKIVQPTSVPPFPCSWYRITHESSIQRVSPNPPQLLKNDSFLENVLQTIDNHLANEFFGVEMFCKEVGISERQLQRKLKAITNKSPNQLISSFGCTGQKNCF